MSVKNTNLDVNEFSLKILMMDKRLRTNCCLLVITLPKTIMLLYCFFFLFQMHMEEGILVYAKTLCLDGWMCVANFTSPFHHPNATFRSSGDKKKGAFMHVRTLLMPKLKGTSSPVRASLHFFYSIKDAASPLRFSRVRFAGRRRCKLLACSI